MNKESLTSTILNRMVLGNDDLAGTIMSSPRRVDDGDAPQERGCSATDDSRNTHMHESLTL
jgi:hypothetical protein